MNLFKEIRSAFTLSETLITLLVIGVISALTIPTLLQNIDNQQNKVAWKKAYSDLENATKRVLQENGGSMKNLCSSGDQHDCLKNIYKQYFNVVKSCDYGYSKGNCWHANGVYKYLDGTVVPDVWGGVSSIVLNNGTMIDFQYRPNCDSTDWGLVNNQASCAYIYIDINGYKNPNRIGKDIFLARLLQDRILPMGALGDIYSGICEGSTGGNSGIGCSAKYLKE